MCKVTMWKVVLGDMVWTFDNFDDAAIQRRNLWGATLLGWAGAKWVEVV